MKTTHSDIVAELDAACARTSSGTRERAAVVQQINAAIKSRIDEINPMLAKAEAGTELLASEQRRWDTLTDEIKSLKAIEHNHEPVRDRRNPALRVAGDDPHPSDLAGTPPFAKAVLDAGFDRRTNPAVTVNATRSLGIKAAIVTPDADDWRRTPPGFVPLPADRRFIFPFMPTTDAGDDTAVTDFRITARELTGTVQRAVDATTEKANLGVTITHVVDEIPQHAVVIDEVPNQLLDSVPMLATLIEQEGRLAVYQSIDDHVFTQITTGAANGETGTGLVAQIRNGIAAMRAAGSSPDLLILDPADAVTLDLIETTGGDYVFPIGGANGSDPTFGVRVVESVAAIGSDPHLIDLSVIGQLYLGNVRFEADPYTGFKKNLTDLRFETNALMHVRDITAAYRIGPDPE